jgi:hypothetical protein
MGARMRRVCDVEGCTKKSPGKLCPKHRSRVARHGSTDDRWHCTGTLSEKFERFVIRGAECWGWTGYTNEHGYGHAARRYAHRVSYELTFGAIPRGLHVLHRCDNPPCTNPSHLMLGTHADNMSDAKLKGRTAAGERSGGRKLTVAAVATIRHLCASGWTQRRVARRFGISQSQVSSIVRREKWASA